MEEGDDDDDDDGVDEVRFSLTKWRGLQRKGLRREIGMVLS